jgi:flagellar biosynthetic protein FlhB
MHIIKAVLAALGLPFLTLIVCGVAGHVIQHRFIFSLEPIMPKFSKVNPLAGLKRLFSSQSLVNFMKGFIKITIVGGAIFVTLWPQRDRFEALVGMDVAGILLIAHTLILKMLGAVMAAMLLIASLDFFYQRTKWHNRQRMSVNELKEEFKHQEGNPEIKAKLRQIRRQRARRRMMAEVPKAAVVITNPTHYAIALKYNKGMPAPVCLAKGTDKVALKIREMAGEHHIPIVENPPLARALHAAVELGDEVPPEHYKAVAQVIGYVMSLKSRRKWAA